MSSNLTFQEDNTGYRSQSSSSGESTMIKILIKANLVKDEKQGQICLVAGSVILLLMSGFIMAKYVFNVGAPATVEYRTPPELNHQLQTLPQNM